MKSHPKFFKLEIDSKTLVGKLQENVKKTGEAALHAERQVYIKTALKSAKKFTT